MNILKVILILVFLNTNLPAYGFTIYTVGVDNSYKMDEGVKPTALNEEQISHNPLLAVYEFYNHNHSYVHDCDGHSKVMYAQHIGNHRNVIEAQCKSFSAQGFRGSDNHSIFTLLQTFCDPRPPFEAAQLKSVQICISYAKNKDLESFKKINCDAIIKDVEDADIQRTQFMSASAIRCEGKRRL